MVMGVPGQAQGKGSRQSPSPHLSQVASSPDLGGGGEPLQGWEIRAAEPLGAIMRCLPMWVPPGSKDWGLLGPWEHFGF